MADTTPWDLTTIRFHFDVYFAHLIIYYTGWRGDNKLHLFCENILWSMAGQEMNELSITIKSLIWSFGEGFEAVSSPRDSGQRGIARGHGWKVLCNTVVHPLHLVACSEDGITTHPIRSAASLPWFSGRDHMQYQQQFLAVENIWPTNPPSTVLGHLQEILWHLKTGDDKAVRWRECTWSDRDNKCSIGNRHFLNSDGECDLSEPHCWAHRSDLYECGYNQDSAIG